MNDWQQYQYLSLGTQKRDGSWVNTPVWFALNGENTVYCFSESKAGKVKRLRNFSAVKINPCTVTGKLLGQWQEACAEVLISAEDEKAAQKSLLASYGWQMRGLNVLSALAGKINKRSYIRIQLKG